MKIDELHIKLIAAARATPPSDRVPYAFEKRILARLRTAPIPDVWGAWAQALWRAAVPCLAIMLVLSAWSLFSPISKSTTTADLAQEMETTVLAAAVQEQAADSVW